MCFFFSLLNNLLNKIKIYFECVYKLEECISMLDMLTALADYASALETSTKPIFGSCLRLRNSIHPIIKKLNGACKQKQVNLNDSSDDNLHELFETSLSASLVTITGANMSGKSAFLRKVGNLQVMAQCGSYVNASEASFRPKRSLLTLSSGFANESVTLNKSSFQLEMAEINYIIKNLDSSSLVIIDELCRSTNYYEGVFIFNRKQKLKV